MKIAIIGGGNMGGAIACGVALGSIIRACDITVTAKSTQTLNKIKAQSLEINISTDNREAVRGADIVLIAVKPWIMEEVISEIKDLLDYSTQSVASVVAGVDFETMHKMLDNQSGIKPTLYRIIPNTAISLRRSVTFICSDGANSEQIDKVVSIFSELGEVEVVSEQMITAGTSLASCGIAFALRYLDASIRGGVELGFSQDKSRAIVIATMEGALEMLRQNNTMPQIEIDRVTTKGGITLKGLSAMEEGGFSNSVIAGLKNSR